MVLPIFHFFQIHKKRRIVGRVVCKNIKSECPAPTCPDPVLLPGRCCKVCPGQSNSEYQSNFKVFMGAKAQYK